MAPRRSRPRRLVLPAVLAVVLAAEITGLAIARTFAPAAPIAPTPTLARAVASGAPAGRPTIAGRIDVRDAGPDPISTVATPTRSIGDGHATLHAIVRADAAHAVSTAGRSRTRSTSGSGHGSSGGHRSGASQQGRNRVWIPSLGIDQAVQSFPCSRSRPPDAGVYRWGCAGRNNVYLLGHAWSTFKPLHDAYVGGRLDTGMTVSYGDGAGSVHTYRVAWWKVVAPTTAASWAWASLDTPSMTLQTCVGANSAYRLMVRLVQVE